MVPVDFEFVLLRLASKDRMLIEHQHRSIGATLAVSPARREAGDATADDHNVNFLPCVGGRPQQLVELLIANTAVRRIDDLMRVAIRASVVADAARPGPLRPEPGHRRCERLRLRAADRSWRGHAE